MVNKIDLIKYIIVIIPLIGIIFPLWTLNVNPAFMGRKWLAIDIYGYGYVDGPIDSLNIANHYVGLKDIIPEEMIELKVLPILYPLISILTYIFLFGDPKKSKYAKYLIISIIVGIVIYFQYWLYRYGHDIDPQLARIEIDPFTPYVIGYYEIANFKILAYFNIGFFLLLIPFIAGLIIKRKYG
ncbi:TPA: hypothetical protein EYP83_00410 [Candidatus Geothermarchaeota archaeon]|nr:hypothetical protein [Candidatus Geothermarchaeota archaeon]